MLQRRYSNRPKRIRTLCGASATSIPRRTNGYLDRNVHSGSQLNLFDFWPDSSEMLDSEVSRILSRNRRNLRELTEWDDWERCRFQHGGVRTCLRAWCCARTG